MDKKIVVMEMRDETEMEKFTKTIYSYGYKAASAWEDLLHQAADEICKYKVTFCIDPSDKEKPFKFDITRK